MAPAVSRSPDLAFLDQELLIDAFTAAACCGYATITSHFYCVILRHVTIMLQTVPRGITLPSPYRIAEADRPPGMDEHGAVMTEFASGRA
jgi:hypothetical protein